MDTKKHNTQNQIIYYEDKEWLFTIKTEDGRSEDFVISRNKDGDILWIDLMFEESYFDELKSVLVRDPEVKIVKDSITGKFIYLYKKCVFSLSYLAEADFFLNGYDDPHIEFDFVKIGHPDFEIFANEALRLRELLVKMIKQIG